MSKFIFLCPQAVDGDDLKVIHNLGSVLEFSKINQEKSAADLFNLYDVILLNVEQFKDWYASYRQFIRNDARIKAVYMYPKHVKIVDEIRNKLTRDWLIDSIVKELPRQFVNKADLIEKLLAGHLSGLAVEEASCFVQLFHAVKSLLSRLG